MANIETELWKPNPDHPGTLVFDSQRPAQDVFDELVAHLTSIGRMPDEYFSLWMDWKDGKPFPKDATISSEVTYGGSEGIYLDISIAYKKDVYEHSRETGNLGWHNRTVKERFATGKTLGEGNDDLDRMNLVASSVTAAFYGYENGIHARYVAEKLNEPEKIVKTIFGDIQPGDWVISTGNNSYAYLIGVVTAITKLGTPEHAAEAENNTDNIHIDFTAFDYPPERIMEIEEVFSDLYDEPKTFDELPLDNVIMAPDMLISLSNLSHDEITRMGNFRYHCETFCNEKSKLDNQHDEYDKQYQLYDKLEAEFYAFLDGLKTLDNEAIFIKSYEITFKREILAFFDGEDFVTNLDAEKLLACETPLHDLYEGWIDADTLYLDYVRDSVENTINKLPDTPADEALETVHEKPSINDRLKKGAKKAEEYKLNKNAVPKPEKDKPQNTR
jgi:hypothetical protein